MINLTIWGIFSIHLTWNIYFKWSSWVWYAAILWTIWGDNNLDFLGNALNICFFRIILFTMQFRLILFLFLFTLIRFLWNLKITMLTWNYIFLQYLCIAGVILVEFLIASSLLKRDVFRGMTIIITNLFDFIRIFNLVDIILLVFIWILEIFFV